MLMSRRMSNESNSPLISRDGHRLAGGRSRSYAGLRHGSAPTSPASTRERGRARLVEALEASFHAFSLTLGSKRMEPAQRQAPWHRRGMEGLGACSFFSSPSMPGVDPATTNRMPTPQHQPPSATGPEATQQRDAPRKPSSAGPSIGTKGRHGHFLPHGHPVPLLPPFHGAATEGKASQGMADGERSSQEAV
jgi:hypothetical protein